jgi:hypothetical protein
MKSSWKPVAKLNRCNKIKKTKVAVHVNGIFMANPLEQLNAMRALSENWDGYGDAAPNGSVIGLALHFKKTTGMIAAGEGHG